MIETRLIVAAVEDVGEIEASDPVPVPWWSFTKTILAAAALALVADGRLCLDALVEGLPFTLRNLLQHRAGIPDYGRLAAYQAAVANSEAPWTRNELLSRVQADRLEFEPGRGWAYSNVGYMLVRDLIEDAAGEGLEAALDKFVFAPLGISGVEVARVPADMAATAWGNPQGYHPGWVYHGLLIGPAADAVLLLHLLLGGKLLPPALLTEMLSPHPVGGAVPNRPWQTAGYGLGLMIGTGDRGVAYIGHTGGGPGSTAAIYQCGPEPHHDGPRRTAAAFAPIDEPGLVERQAMDLALTVRR